jgi:hypothetical protein
LFDFSKVRLLSAQDFYQSQGFDRSKDLEKGKIEIKAISTYDQAGDIFTKPLSKIPFKKLRFLLLGW